MKRNKIFIDAYIAFIFICVPIKFVYDFSMWNQLVFAITVTGWFFTLGDIFDILVSNCKEDVEIYEPLAKSMLKELECVEEKNNKLQLDNGFFNAAYEFAYKENCNNIHLYKVNIKKLNERIEIDKEIKKLYEKVIKICIFIGCLLFFCILTFYEIFEFFLQFQEYVSVIAFGSILLVQQKNIKHMEKMEDIRIMSVKMESNIKEIGTFIDKLLIRMNGSI